MKILEATRITLDGKPVYKFPCPGCGVIGRADEDQAAGRVSCECPQCGWHETVALHDDFHYVASFRQRQPRKRAALGGPDKGGTDE